MNTINRYVSFYSLTAVIIIIERITPFTKTILQPAQYIRLHELIQTTIFIPITVVLSVLMLYEITNKFSRLKGKFHLLLIIIFFIGVYFYGAGEGWHEVTSFTLNRYCDIHHIVGNLCGGLFINDYYTGNLIFFVGGVLMNFVLMLFALFYPVTKWNHKQMTILLANSIVYAFTWYAYSAFDVVLVGLYFSSLLALLSLGCVVKIKRQWSQYPYITYSAIAYTLATLGTLLTRFH